MNATTPFNMPQNKLPDLLISGETVEQILVLLNNSIIFAKSQDGSMRPFVDPMPVIQILQTALQQATRSGESE